MLSVAGRYWRMGATGVAFGVFGLGGGLLAITVFPLIMCVVPERELAQKRVRYVIHMVFRLYLWFVRAIGLYDVTVDGRDILSSRTGCVVIANHPTLLDVVLVMSASANFQCVVKYQLWHNFFLRGVVKAAGFIRNDLNGEEFIAECEKAFAAGDNLLVFPEGTRTIPGEFPKLFRGFANIAILAEADIQAVVIQCKPISLIGKGPWYNVPKTRSRFHLTVGDLWRVESYNKKPTRALNARHLVRNIEAYYRKALSNDRP